VRELDPLRRCTGVFSVGAADRKPAMADSNDLGAEWWGAYFRLGIVIAKTKFVSKVREFQNTFCNQELKNWKTFPFPFHV
jgi:hypothetical protein